MMVSNKDVAEVNIKAENLGEIACLYLLVNEGKQTVYVGETENVKERIGQHRKGGPKSKHGKHEFSKVAIMWDGRPIQTTLFSDNTIRKELEASLIREFGSHGKFEPVNTSSSGSRANLQQKETIRQLREELFFILYKFGYLKELPREKQDSRGLTDEETAKLLSANGLTVREKRGRWSQCESGHTVYSTSASQKRWGWQITIRDDLMKKFEAGDEGLYLLLQRTKPYLLPYSFLGQMIRANRGSNTIDLYIDDQNNRLKCGRQNDIDVSEYVLEWPPRV